MQNVNQSNARLEIIRASEIEPREIEWLWYPFIPYGKVTLVQGDPGDGKSTFMLTIAALLTRGEPLPFTETDEPLTPVNVIYQTTEDHRRYHCPPLHQGERGQGAAAVHQRKGKPSDL